MDGAVRSWAESLGFYVPKNGVATRIFIANGKENSSGGNPKDPNNSGFQNSCLTRCIVNGIWILIVCD